MQNDEHTSDPETVNTDAKSFKPQIKCSELDQGDIGVFSDPNMVRITIDFVKQLDIHMDTEGNLYLVATLQDKDGDVFLLVKKILLTGDFHAEEHIIKLTYDSQVGTKCHYKTSRCWKGFRNHIYYFTMENYRHEKLWKLNVLTGEKESLGEWTNQYKTWDIQF